MSSDLRVALRIQANSGNSRRVVQALERDLRKAGKDGAKALADDSNKASTALSKTGQVGAASYKIIRQAMRDTSSQGSNVFRQGVIQTQADLKQMGQIGRQAARETKAELVRAAKEGTEPLRRSVERTEDSFRRLAQNGGRNLRMLKTVAAGVRREFDRIKGLGSTAQGQLAGLGVGVGVVSGLTGSAKLDRQLVRTRQTADMTPAQKDEWRNEGWRIARTYGVSREEVDSGFNTLIASGVNYDAARKTADAIGQTTAVTGADSGVLGKAVVAGASAFNINLNKDGAALELLQKMTVAGRLGNAELENLADLFPKIGGAASAAGMSIAQALAFTETLSTVEMQPDRLGTLTESTLRIFSNKQYRDQVTKATGVGFFNKDGSSRNPQDVFGDLKRKYDKMNTDEKRAKFMGVVFKGMDQDTVRGARIMLTGDRLTTFAEQSKKVDGAGPVIGRDLKENTASASGTASRMKATLGQAIDRMAIPLNKGFADFGSYLLDDLNLSGEQMLAGGAALGVGGYYAGRGAKAGAGALLNKFLGGPETIKNIAVGKVLEEATGVTSVFVTNWPSGMPLDGGVPDLPGGSSAGKGKGKPGGFIAPWLGPVALGFTATQLGSSTGQNTDEDRLAMVSRNKLIDDGQRTYQTAFYRNRISLLEQNPGQSSNWASEQARRLAQNETGLTAAGGSVSGASSWAAGVAGRAVDSGMATIAAAQKLNELMGKPLVIEIRTDSDYIFAELERRLDVQLRRGQ
ncbi:phage tail tape measure protein [Pseudomonas marginalis]|uniref:Phage tail tape measure protein n=1 Tax=Pseudomonas marginalis TaxID=298 RepID=A0A9X9BPF6_PSEMA|nr:phage tail tape measure protein [Pseudomonas marginalis]TWR55584.1 phage tail tape measure protein [Pseudomonas marginalis]SEC23552.1 Phage-related minor tail protein [Pseudomonas marginalis]